MAEANQFVVECLDLMDELDGGEIFCPRIPSVTIRSIFNAIVPPNHDYKEIGQRIGDKLHEYLILKEELTHTTLFKGKYVIMPENPSWPYREPLRIKPNIKEGINMTSENNENFLDAEQILKTL